jgi:hypothetical protein
MESNNYNGVHILSEAVIMGGISMYFYKEISDLKSTIEDLKGQITMQNNQIRYLLTSHTPQQSFGQGTNWTNQQQPYTAPQQPSTPLRIPTPVQNNGVQLQKEFFSSRSNNEVIHHNYSLEQHQRYLDHKQSKLEQQPQNMECEGGVCRLVPKTKSNEVLDSTTPPTDKKVVISKISKQIEFDRENINPDQTSKVNTFTNFSPNPLLKSVTPKPSTSVNPLENDCNEEEGTKSTLEKILHAIDDE